MSNRSDSLRASNQSANVSVLLTDIDATEKAQDLFEQASQSPLQKHYADFYRSLSQLKEEFHSLGRFDDANAKLDEIVKFLSMKMLEGRFPDHAPLLDIEQLRARALRAFGDRRFIARALQDAFKEAASNPMFVCKDGSSVFGDSPTLNIRATEDGFAERLVSLLSKLPVEFGDAAADEKEGLKVDPVNEAFGHFLRRNFASRVEDAQYMTPPEVVDAMARIAVFDLLKEKTGSRNGKQQCAATLCDPTCGVGSLILGGLKRIELHDGLKDCRIVGQDKVDRMVRLAKLNLMLFGKSADQIQHGNSIVGNSFLDEFLGEVDLILTNPPFGAKIVLADALQNDATSRFPITSTLAEKGYCPRIVDSEFLLLDRCLGLLKEEGKVLIIVPDSVVSSGRFAADFREEALRLMELRAVIDLPVETFAQAGTRTKTSIIYGVKRAARSSRKELVYMASANSLGFKVKERSGSTVKVATGENELWAICNSYCRHGEQNGKLTKVAISELINGKWTAAFYAARPESPSKTSAAVPGDYEFVPLEQMAYLLSKQRKELRPDSMTKCISVLHVNQAGIVDLAEVEKYSPKFLGPQVFSGDVLLSKLNPHIPRVTIVPDTPWPVTCSTEFEILTPKEKEFSPILLYLAVTHPFTQEQIVRLSSGTSSSHRRIKQSELLQVKVPIPKKGTRAFWEMTETASSLKAALTKVYGGLSTLWSVRQAYARKTTATPPSE